MQKKFLLAPGCMSHDVTLVVSYVIEQLGLLTYMSIRQEWLGHVRAGRLFRLGFLVPGKPEKRTVLMSQEIHDLVSGPWTNDLMEDRCNRLRANLEGILAGDQLNVCWEPYEGAVRHQIGRLDKPAEEIWDVRSVDQPALRAFFRFAEFNVLILFTCSPRSVPVPWMHRLPLLGRKSKEWKRAKTECRRQWGILFPAHEPHKGDSLNDYLSNAISS
jgi:hypothetical protein